MSSQIDIYTDHLSEKQFNLIRDFVEGIVGIKMPSTKKIMIESRIRKRLKTLNIGSFSEYLDYVFKSQEDSQEAENLIDVITTNKTEFFREFDHFLFLKKSILPELVKSGNKIIRIWSAACSSGEEVYSIAITISEFIESQTQFLDFSILGTDISNEMLNKSLNAIYKTDSIQNIPKNLLQKYFLKSKDPIKDVVRITKRLRDKTTFKRLNFMDTLYHLESFDVIFCRNALIYFDASTQLNIIQKLTNHLHNNGYLLLGHSENIGDNELNLKRIGASIYKKIG